MVCFSGAVLFVNTEIRIWLRMGEKKNNKENDFR